MEFPEITENPTSETVQCPQGVFSRSSSTENPQGSYSRSGSTEGPQGVYSRSGSTEGPQGVYSRSGSTEGPQGVYSRSGSTDGPQGVYSRSGSTEGPQSVYSRSESTEGAQGNYSRSGSTEQPMENQMENRRDESLRRSVEEYQRERSDRISLASSASQEYNPYTDTSMSAPEVFPAEAMPVSEYSNETEPSERTISDRDRDMDSEDQIESYGQNQMEQLYGNSFESVSMPSTNSLAESEDQRQKDSWSETDNLGSSASECHQQPTGPIQCQPADPIHTPTVDGRQSIIELPMSATYEYDNMESPKTVTIPVQTIYPILQRKECPEDSGNDREENMDIPMAFPDQNQEQPFEDPTSGDRTYGDQTSGDRTYGDQTSGDQMYGDQTSGDQTSGDRMYGDRTYGDRTYGDQTSGYRTYGDQTSGDQTSGDRLYGNQTSGDRMYGDQTYEDQTSGDQTYGQRTYGDQTSGDRMYGDQMYGNQTSGARTYGDQTYGDQDNMKITESSHLVPSKQDSPQSTESQEKMKRYMDWMEKEQDGIESSEFGSNRVGVEKAREDIKARSNDIQKRSPEIQQFLQNQDPKIPEVREANLVFETLNALIDKQSACLDVIYEIASLEESVQKCNLAVRKNWQWVGKMMECTQVHFNNASNFHQFFHDAQEAEYWMKNTLANIHMTFDRSKLEGDMIDVNSMKNEMKEVLSAYIQWQGKIDSLFDRAKNVLPVPQRIIPLEDSRPATALIDYRTDEFEMSEGESITLLDNSDKTAWKVKNSFGKVGTVPAVLVLIPGPYPNAIDVAVKMRIQLLALWTASVKRLGYKLIAFMLLVVKDYNDEEIKKLSMMSQSQRKELLTVLKFIEDAMVEQWNGYGDFEELQERMESIRMIFEEHRPTSASGSGDQFSSSVVIQVGALQDLLTKYKDFWAYWETYKVIVELLRQPKFILICDKWEQLRFVTTAHFVKFWDTHLDVNTVAEIDKIDQVVADKCLAIHETPKESMGTSDVTVSTELEETETEQVETTVEEEERTFFMKNVMDPRDEKILTFQQAVIQGIIDQANNRYINPDTGVSVPIGEAINSGKISLEWTSKRKIRQEKKSYGLITIKTTRETRPYTIKEVVDPQTDKPIPVAEAMERGILDTHNSVYKTKDGEDMQMTEAIDLHKVIVDYHGDKHSKPETITKTYAVSAVVDQRKKDKVPFAEAINHGLLDKANGFYVNNVTGEKVHIGEAIMRGFIKARVVTDVSKLDINPENKIVVERVQNLRNKVMKGIKAINAMKMLKK